MDISKPRKIQLKYAGLYTSIDSKPSARLSKYYKSLYDSKKIDTIFKRRSAIQQDYIKKYMVKLSVNPLCQSVVHKRYDLDVEQLIIDSQKNFYSPDLLRAMSCYSSYSVFINSPYKGDEQNNNIYSFWDKIRAVASGEQGTIYESTKEEQDDAFLVKSTTEAVSDYDTYHEIFTGFVLNRYRSQIPNFMYTYGYIDICGPVSGTKLSGVKNICLTGGLNIYSIVERINPGITLKDHLNDGLVTEDFIKLYLQIILSLYTARDIRYVHNDLHTGNIVMRDLSKTTLVPYKFGTKTIYIKTNQIPTIIDYGLSYFELGGEKFGIYGLEGNGVYWDRYHPVMDAFKLLMFMIQDVGYISNPIEKLFRFFDKKSDIDKYFEKRANKEKKYYFDISASNKTLEYSHEALISYIIANNPRLLTDPSDEYKILGCKGLCEFNYKNYVTNDGFLYSSFSFRDMIYDPTSNKIKIVQKYNPHVNLFLDEDLTNFQSNVNHLDNLMTKIKTETEQHTNFKLLRSYILRAFGISGAVSTTHNQQKYGKKIKKIIPDITSYINKTHLVLNLIRQSIIQYKSITMVLKLLKPDPRLFKEGELLTKKFSSIFHSYTAALKKLDLYLVESYFVYIKGYNFFKNNTIKQFLNNIQSFQNIIHQSTG